MSPPLRLLGMLIYAPARGLRHAGERERLLFPALFALSIQTLYSISFNSVPELTLLVPGAALRWTLIAIISFFWSALSLAIVGLIFVPAVVFLAARWFGRVGILAALQRDYARLAPAVFCGMGVAYVWGFALSLVLRASGLLMALVQKTLPSFEQVLAQNPDLATKIGPVGHAEVLAMTLLQIFVIPGIVIALWLAVRAGFNFSKRRAFVITLAGCMALLGFELLLSNLAGAIVAAPLLMVMSFVVLRASFLSALERRRAVAAFEQAVTAADRSPFDPRAQFDLGMLLLNRGEMAQAGARFERTIAQDPQDWEAHFQLGRIARSEGRWADAIKLFEPVVENDFGHSHYEIWREVGATYLGARQFADAVTTLERFLDHRPHDAEGWYLLGQAQDGLGNGIEATAAMHACLSAIEGLPAEQDERLRALHAQAAAYLNRERK